MKTKKTKPTKEELKEAVIIYDPYTKKEVFFIVLILVNILALVLTGVELIKYFAE